MDRSRSKRYFYDQDYESETLNSRTKPRYSNNSRGGGGGGGHHYDSGYHRRSSSTAGGGGRKMNGTSLMVTTTYRILCHDVKAGGVIGKSGSIIKTIRQRTGAWINVHEVIPGDEERIIEISDTRRRDPDDRMPAFSHAQEALFLIHERILETEVAGCGYNVGFGEDEDDEYGNRGGNRVVTRLVVSRMHVGSLMGKGGKIIEQMRIETKTHIRILPRDHNLPRCVDMSEEIVQVVGDMNAVKKAIAIISSRLRESQHRDRSQFHNRLHSDNFFPPDDDFQLNSTSRRSPAEGPNIGLRNFAGAINNNYSSHSSDNAHSFSGEEIVFRILCSIEKVDCVVGESDGIVDLLQKEIGVNVDVVDPVAGSDEHIIIISSEEGPDDELFPAQEALLHIQNRIVDLAPEKGNIVTTRLLLQSDECGCLGLKDGSSLKLGKFGGAKVNVLSREELPVGLSGTCEIVQIVGEIKAAREALVEVTSSIRSYIHGDFFEKDNSMEPQAASNNSVTTSPESQAGNGPVTSATAQRVKDVVPPEPVKQKETERSEDQPSVLNRISKPLVTRSILEVVIPPHAAPLVTKPRKLTMISQISGAMVKLIDDKPDVTEKIIRISGTPEQTERAQSLLQGFILSTEEDGP